MFDETQSKIIQATMDLVMEWGYASTTTKDIARRAGINECTIFRKFKGKKKNILQTVFTSLWKTYEKNDKVPEYLKCNPALQDSFYNHYASVYLHGKERE